MGRESSSLMMELGGKIGSQTGWRANQNHLGNFSPYRSLFLERCVFVYLWGEVEKLPRRHRWAGKQVFPFSDLHSGDKRGEGCWEWVLSRQPTVPKSRHMFFNNIAPSSSRVLQVHYHGLFNNSLLVVISLVPSSSSL